MRKVVVFGGAGYIGGAVTEFMKDEFEVVVADVRPPASPHRVHFTHCDVRDIHQVTRALSGAAAAIYFSVIQIPQINTNQRLGYEVNVRGLQNVCEATLQTPSIKGLVLSGTWHVFGERGLSGIIDESFGFRPDKVEDRAKTYALCKIVQESVMRLYDEMGHESGKTFGVIRMGTVLGERMPDQTAAALFIKNGLKGEPLTPYRNSMYRPMLYVDILDVCRGYTNFVKRITNDQAQRVAEGPPHVVNLLWPEPITILGLAEIVRDVIEEETNGKTIPHIQIKDTGIPSTFSPEDKTKIRVDSTKALSLMGLDRLTDPRDSVRRIVESRISKNA